MSAELNASPVSSTPAVRVLENPVAFGPGKLRVTVEADTIDAVLGVAAKRAAIKFASEKGCSKPGISSQSGAYPVDKDGNILRTQVGVRPLYRNDIDVQGDL